MPELRKIGIVAAMAREVSPLIKGYARTERSHEGRVFVFHESEQIVAVCGGIGLEAARRASEALIALYHPSKVVSAGFAGALDSSLHVGDVFSPALVIDALDGSRVEAGGSSGRLLTFGSVAGVKQKANLARAYEAPAIDMEAAAVARAAGRHGIPFCAVKAISDEAAFELPGLERFVVPGQGSGFRLRSFLMYVLLRPWLWGKAIRLGTGSRKAARSLCEHLRTISGRTQGETGRPEVEFAARTKC